MGFMDKIDIFGKLGSVGSKIDLKKAAAATMAFGKKNAPALAAGGSIAMNWGALFLFGKELLVAQKRIDIKVATMNAEVATGDNVLGTMKAERDLTWQEKAIMYLECCWPSLVVKLGADVLSAYGAKFSMNEITSALMLASMYKEDGEKLKKQILEDPEAGKKKLDEYEKKSTREEYPPEKMIEEGKTAGGEGRTLFIEKKTGRKVWGDLTTMQRKIYDIRDDMDARVDKAYKRKFGDAFFASDSPYPDDTDVYVTLDYDALLEALGFTKRGDKTDMGDIIEVRHYYGEGDFLNFNEVFDMDPTRDPVTGVPVLCYVNFNPWIHGTQELQEREP